ncbi:hypothetical protein Hanom_Chr04g00375501 [Helianthus anomalus]
MHSLRKLGKFNRSLVFLGCHILPPLIWNFVPKFRSSSFSLSSGCTVREQLGVLFCHSVFAFPGILWATFGVPTNSHKRDSLVFEDLHIPVRDFYWFLDELQPLVDGEFLERNDKGLI